MPTWPAAPPCEGPVAARRRIVTQMSHAAGSNDCVTSSPGPVPSVTDNDVMGAAQRSLRSLAGQDASMRPDQWSAIEALVVDRRRALVVQRTGWGKSAVYFIATALLRERRAGPTVIVSPLLALVREQVAAGERAG